MPLFQWSERYSVGIERFDAEHEGLFNLMNQLHDATRAGHERAILQDLFQKLMDYTEQHFSAEEEAMRFHHFPNAAEHKAEHDKLRVKTAEFLARYKSSGSHKIGIDLLNFLLRWWTDHILGTDKLYGEFFNNKKHKLPGRSSRDATSSI